jgi:hypothetical protein
MIEVKPQNLIGDKAYDNGALDTISRGIDVPWLAERDGPHR